MIVFCSSSRQITGCGVSLLNSVEWAPGKLDDVAAEFDHGALHAQANAEKRNAAFAGEANGFDFAFDAAFAEAAGHQHAVEAGQQPLGAFVFDQFALNALNADLRPMVNAGVIERFVNRFVSVAMLGVFADHGDRNFVLRIAQAVAAGRANRRYRPAARSGPAGGR